MNLKFKRHIFLGLFQIIFGIGFICMMITLPFLLALIFLVCGILFITIGAINIDGTLKIKCPYCHKKMTIAKRTTKLNCLKCKIKII
jgi:DNA-directed RNA polymerase subunit RPC12/RpoP